MTLTSKQIPKLGVADSYPSFCLSACVYVLAAGIERYASPLAVIGVHQAHRTMSLYHRAERLPEPEFWKLHLRLAKYLEEMGEESRLIETVEASPPDRIHIMVPDEEKNTGLVTFRLDEASAISSKPPKYGLVGAPLKVEYFNFEAVTRPWKSPTSLPPPSEWDKPAGPLSLRPHN